MERGTRIRAGWEVPGEFGSQGVRVSFLLFERCCVGSVGCFIGRSSLLLKLGLTWVIEWTEG